MDSKLFKQYLKQINILVSCAVLHGSNCVSLFWNCHCPGDGVCPYKIVCESVCVIVWNAIIIKREIKHITMQNKCRQIDIAIGQQQRVEKEKWIHDSLLRVGVLSKS